MINWKVIAPWALFVICGIVLLVTMLGSNKTTDNKYFDLLLAQKDSMIKRERDYQVEIKQYYQPLIEDSKRKDSLLAIKSKVNTVRYEAVPINVNSIPDNELRSAIIERYNLPSQ